MGGCIRRIDEKIIHVDDEPAFCDHIMKRVIHESLESGRGVSKAKEHHSWFKESFMSDKDGFPLVSILNADIIIFPTNIKFGEDFRSLEFVNKVRDEGKGIYITDCVFIDVAVVLTGAKTAVLLFDEEERRCLWRV